MERFSENLTMSLEIDRFSRVSGRETSGRFSGSVRGLDQSDTVKVTGGTFRARRK